MKTNRFTKVALAGTLLAAVLVWQLWRSAPITVADPVDAARPAAQLAGNNATGSGAAIQSSIVTQEVQVATSTPTGFGSRSPSGGESRARPLTNIRDHASFGAVMLQASAASDTASRTLLSEMISFCIRNTSRPAKAAAASRAYVPYRVRVPIGGDAPQVIENAEVQSRFEANKLAIQEFCRDFDLKAAIDTEKLALGKLAAEQANYVKLMAAFEKGIDPNTVTPGQFELIAKSLDEKDIGTLLLLGEQLRPLLEKALEATASQAEVRQPPNFAASFGTVAWQLALCQLGAECGGDSIWAAQMCFRFGACAGDDLAGSLRAALIRDGVAPDVLDKQAALFAAAITSGDPARLGIVRRKKV